MSGGGGGDGEGGGEVENGRGKGGGECKERGFSSPFLRIRLILISSSEMENS